MKALRTYIASFLARIRRMRHDIFYSPERYWAHSLALVAIWVVAVIALDGYIFWRMALRIDTDIVNSETPIEYLNKRQFDTTLNMLTKRRELYERTLTGLSTDTTPTTTPRE